MATQRFSAQRPARVVRDSMRALPAWLQPILTWLTGLPATGESPMFRWTATSRIASAVLAYALWLTIGAWALQAGGISLALLVPALLLLTGSARWFYIVAGHYAAHGDLTNSPKANRWLAEILSTLFLTIPFEAYRRDHHVFHHSWRLGTPLDPDARMLYAAGIRPGLNRRALWRRVLQNLFSPTFHARFFFSRLRLNLLARPLWRSAAAAIWIVIMLGVVAITDTWLTWFVLWLLPSVFGFQASALLQFLSEHRWFLRGQLGRERMGRMTFARFLGDHFPGAAGTIREHLAWWARLLFVHWPARAAVLVGDLPQHDYHHRRFSDWANASHAREGDVEAGVPGWPEPYFEVTGSLADHIDEVLRGLAERPPLTGGEHSLLLADPEVITKGEAVERLQVRK